MKPRTEYILRLGVLDYDLAFKMMRETYPLATEIYLMQVVMVSGKFSDQFKFIFEIEQ